MNDHLEPLTLSAVYRVDKHRWVWHRDARNGSTIVLLSFAILGKLNPFYWLPQLQVGSLDGATSDGGSRTGAIVRWTWGLLYFSVAVSVKTL